MHEHYVLKSLLIEYLNKECVLVARLSLQLYDMSVNVIYVLVLELLKELPLELC